MKTILGMIRSVSILAKLCMFMLALLVIGAGLVAAGHSLHGVAGFIGQMMFIVGMAAATADRVTQEKQPGLKSYPIAASTKIIQGTMVMLNANGFLIEAADAASGKVVGVADKTVDNSSGADGALSVNVRKGIFRFGATSITQAMVGTMMYVVDNQTFDDALGTNGVKAGRLVEFISTTEGWISIEAEMGVGVVLANAGGTYTSAEQNLINDLKTKVNSLIAG